MTSHPQQALYRKYRPATFADVAGQGHVVEVLEKAIENDKLAHAYLFAGTRGTGKTSVARIFAAAIGTTAKDLYEMDAASNRKIDDFRELNDSVHTLPFDSPYKVYIIDEVHMLTKEAFNAFLKTLEEPPAHVIFILATTELEKLPETIVSRCQTFTFRTPTRAELAEVITRAAKKEEATLNPDAAELIALLADGSFRDALGTLQKVLTYSGDTTLSRTEVEKVTGAPQAALIAGMLDALAAGDTDAALTQVNTAVQEGADMLTLQKLLLDRVRAVLLLRHAPNTHALLKEQFSTEALKQLNTLAQEKENAITPALLAVLLRAYADTPHAYIPQLPFELAVTGARHTSNTQ